MIDLNSKVRVQSGPRVGDEGYVDGHSGDVGPRKLQDTDRHQFRVRFSDGKTLWFEEEQLEELEEN